MSSDISDDRVRRLLEYDPLLEAESESQVTGVDADAIGLFNVHANAAAKQEALSKRRDTFWSCPIDYFREILKIEGFWLIDKTGVQGDEEQFYWQPEDGILLHSSQHGETDPHLDAASLYFNCLVPFGKWKELRGVPCSSAPVKLSTGDEFTCRYTLDGREGMRFKLRKLRTYGAFVSPWIMPPLLTPLVFSSEWYAIRRARDDTSFLLEDPSVVSVHDKRIARMPVDVRACLAVCQENRR